MSAIKYRINIKRLVKEKLIWYPKYNIRLALWGFDMSVDDDVTAIPPPLLGGR